MAQHRTALTKLIFEWLYQISILFCYLQCTKDKKKTNSFFFHLTL